MKARAQFTFPGDRSGQVVRAGFTLVEMLVVIVIIAILAALLFPVFGSLRNTANQTTSISNLRQWGIALGTSIIDNDNTLPWEGQPVTLSDATAWYNRLPPYLNEKPFSKMKTGEFPRAGQKSIWINPAVPTSVNEQYKPYLFFYAMNYFLSTSALRMLRITSIDRLTVTVFMADKNDDFANCNPKFIKAYFGAGNVDTDPRNAANFLFCDGHVSSLRRRDFDPNLGAKSIKDPPDSGFTFLPYEGAQQQ